MRVGLAIALGLFVAAAPGSGIAQVANSADLAKKLANPVADLISVPFENDYDCCYGPSDASRWQLEIEPVIPFHLNPEWNLISRTILPVVALGSPAPGLGETFALGDTLQSFFLSPNTEGDGTTWGIGPAISLPTGTDSLVDIEKWSIGPTFVVLKQDKGWTYGILTHHIWSFADAGGGEDQPEVNQTYLQPFLAFTWKDSTTLTLNSEAGYNWTAEQWEIPLNLMVSHIYHLGEQPVSLEVGGRWYPETPRFGPDWGLRATATFLFPQKGG